MPFADGMKVSELQIRTDLPFCATHSIMHVTVRLITAASVGPCRTDWVMGAMVELEIICQYWPLAD